MPASDTRAIICNTGKKTLPTNILGTTKHGSACISIGKVPEVWGIKRAELTALNKGKGRGIPHRGPSPSINVGNRKKLVVIKSLAPGFRTWWF
jgi:hypothetical protein